MRHSSLLDVQKQSKFKGEHLAKDVDNFICTMEEYLRLMQIKDEKKKLTLLRLILSKILWCGGETYYDDEYKPITTGRNSKVNVVQYSTRSVIEEVWIKLRHFVQKGDPWEYFWNFQNIQILKLDSKDEFCHFANGHKTWALLELQMRDINDLKVDLTRVSP